MSRINGEAFADRRLLVRVPRLNIGTRRISPSAQLIPGMRGHVVEMACSWDLIAQRIGAGLSAARLGSGFGEMDVKVARTHVAGIHGDDPFELFCDALHVRG